MSSNNKKYYRTVFKIEVLSSEPIKDGIGLKEIANEKRITELLENQGSDASFLIEELWDD